MFAPISPVLNVYISIERYISIAYPTKKYFLLKNKIQLAYIIVSTLFNLLLYAPNGIYFDLISVENQTVCNYVNLFWQETYGYIDLTNRIIIPSLLMIIFSILIIHTIFTSRSRISSNIRANRTFRKDVKFSVISIILNISFIVFNLPLSILLFLQNYWLYSYFSLFVFIYYTSFAANFYLIFLANSLFREGFYSIFVCENKRTNTNNAVIPRENIELQNIQTN